MKNKWKKEEKEGKIYAKYIKRQSFLRNKIFAQKDLIYALICLVVLVIVLAIKVFSNGKDSFNWADLIDVDTFFAVVAVFILNAFTNFILAIIQSKREDKLKLTNDYDSLLKMYINISPVVYRNSSKAKYKLGRKKTHCSHEESNENEDTYKIPLANVIPFKNQKVYIYDEPNKMYQLPERIDKIMTDIYKAHGFSKIYNQMNIRCDKIKQCSDNRININFSRTTYLYSLVTNRAMDYKHNGISVRDLYAYGPFLPSLEESKLSNHIGFNGLVETNDNYFIFILRHKHVSIAKNTLQQSVGASLKVKYALDENMRVTKEGIVNAIRNEIEDELNLKNLDNYDSRKKEIFSNLTFDSILCFYREIMEGGKPQFLFYSKIDVSKDDLAKAYQKGVKGIKKSHKDGLICRIDGYKMLFVERKDLNNMYITPDTIVIGKKAYKTVPSSAGSIALIIKYLNSNEISVS